jgi:hypothetical protein
MTPTGRRSGSSSGRTATRPLRQLTLQGIATPIAITRYTIGKQGVEMTGEEAEITEGIDEESSRCAASSSE